MILAFAFSTATTPVTRLRRVDPADDPGQVLGEPEIAVGADRQNCVAAVSEGPGGSDGEPGDGALPGDAIDPAFTLIWMTR